MTETTAKQTETESAEEREARHQALAIRKADQAAQENAEQAISTAKSRKPAGKVRTGNPQTDRDIRAASNGASAKTSAKPARQPRATSRAPKPGVTRTVPASKPKATEASNGTTEKTFSDYRRELSRAVIVAAGELVSQAPREHRAELAQAISNQLHHLTTPKAGWPKGKLPVPQRNEWTAS